MTNSIGTKYHQEIDINGSGPLSIALRHINENTIILDVGCACGDMGIALKKYKNAQIYGLEYNQESVKLAQETNAYEEVHQFNLDTLSENDFSQYKEKFDYIICGDVLEHLRFPQDTLKILKTYLKENGSIIASIPNIAHMSIKANLLVNDFTYTPLGLLDETHIHLFTYKSIAEMLSNLGLKIENCEWTLQSKQAWQPNNPYPYLSKNIQQFLFNDWHSFVCQYVVILNQTQDETNLLQHNIQKLNINEEKAPENIKTYRTQLLQELGEVDKIQDNQIQADIALKNKIIEEQEQSLKNTIKTNTEITQLLSTQKHEIEVLKNEINKNLNKMLENDKEINNLQKVLSEHENKILSQTLENQNLQQDIQKQSEKIEKLKNKIHRKKRKYQIIILSLCIIYLLMFISILAR